MENSKFVLGSKYDLRTKLILLIGANILIFIGFGLIYQSLISLFFLAIIISDGYKKSAIRYILFFAISVVLEKKISLFEYKFSYEFNFIPLGNWEKIFAMYYHW